MLLSELSESRLKVGMLVKSLATGKEGRIIFVNREVKDYDEPLGPEVFIEWDKQAPPVRNIGEAIRKAKGQGVSSWWARLLDKVEVLDG